MDKRLDMSKIKNWMIEMQEAVQLAICEFDFPAAPVDNITRQKILDFVRNRMGGPVDSFYVLDYIDNYEKGD